MVDSKLLKRLLELRPAAAMYMGLRDVLGRKDRVMAAQVGKELARVERAIARQISKPLEVGEDEYLISTPDGRLQSISHLELCEMRAREADQAAAELAARKLAREEERELVSLERELAKIPEVELEAVLAELGDDD